MSEVMHEGDWQALLRHVKSGKCTPIIGDGVLSKAGLDRATFAAKLAKDHNCPLADAGDLSRVTQFMAVNYDDKLLHKYDVLDLLNSAPVFDANVTDDIHNVLARLDLPVYVTTNYDDRMFTALEAQGKAPRRDLYPWNEFLKEQPGAFDTAEGFNPDTSNPVVYHLYGHAGVPESLVLTEDDHLDYLSSMSAETKALPARIQEALSRNSLLFIGYRLDTLSFRVLLRSIFHAVTPMHPRNLAVQLPPSSSDELHLDYLTRYFEKFAEIKARIYWCDVQCFARELDLQWEEYRHG
jgi:hypothetical protein